jgi:ABC-type transport system involved in Fe-S cluster assembly fused permease/ATPase subunit
MIDIGHMQVNKLENLATGKAVDALLNYETVVQVCPHLLAHGK